VGRRKPGDPAGTLQHCTLGAVSRSHQQTDQNKNSRAPSHRQTPLGKAQKARQKEIRFPGGASLQESRQGSRTLEVTRFIRHGCTDDTDVRSNTDRKCIISVY
jgi:hypothetical protein